MDNNRLSELPHNCPAVSGKSTGNSMYEADLALLKHRLETLESCQDEHDKHITLLLKYSQVIDDIVKEQEARRKFWESIASSVTSAGAWAVIVAVGSAIWYTAQSKLGKP